MIRSLEEDAEFLVLRKTNCDSFYFYDEKDVLVFALGVYRADDEKLWRRLS